MRVRTTGTVLAGMAAGAALLLAMAAPAYAATQFCGLGRGLTADVAIQGAIWDAQSSADSEQLFNCTVAGQPTIFETFNDPYFGHRYSAVVTLSCTP